MGYFMTYFEEKIYLFEVNRLTGIYPPTCDFADVSRKLLCYVNIEYIHFVQQYLF